MVAADHGQEVARTVASALVVYLQRPGGQSQFSLPMRTRTPERVRLRDLQTHIDSHPADDLSIAALATRVSMSPGHFSRVFVLETGLAPGKYVERSRAEAARRLLETTDEPQTSIAHTCGLGSPRHAAEEHAFSRTGKTRSRTSPPLFANGMIILRYEIEK